MCGQSLSGKTALALSFAATVLATGGGVVWFEATHSPWEIERRLIDLLATCQDAIQSPPFSAISLVIVPIASIAQACEALTCVRNDVVMARVLPSGSCTASSTKSVLQAVFNLKLVVFDSVATILSPLLGLRIQPGWTGHVALDQLAALLRWFAAEGRAAVVITNRVTIKQGKVMPALGNKWASFVDISLTLHREDDDRVWRTSEVGQTEGVPTPIVTVHVESKRDRPSRCRVMISDHGIRDVPDNGEYGVG